MSAPLNTALKFCFPIRKMSDGTRFKPTPDPTVDAALYPDGSAIAGVVLSWDATNLEYTYTLASGNVTLTGPHRISILVTDAAAASMAYEAEWEVEAVPTSVTAVQVRTEMDANSTRLAEIATDVDGIAAVPTNPLLTTDSRLNNLDATISSRSTLTAAQVWAYGTRTLSSFGTLIADLWSYASRTLTGNGSEVRIVSPVDEDENIQALYQATSYYAAEGRALVWHLPNTLNYAGATAQYKGSGVSLVPVINAGAFTATLELSAVDTAAMTLGYDTYGLTITFANTHPALTKTGRVRVKPNPS